MNNVWEICLNANTDRKCYFYGKPKRNKPGKLTCDKNGVCNPRKVAECNEYEPGGCVDYMDRG